jgi:dihydrofolate reductase
MRKIIYSGNISLDGYMEDENGDFDWTEPSEEVHRFWNQWIREAGATLMGRRTYETMEPYWTDAAANPSGQDHTDEFARAWVETPRYAVSRTLESVPAEITLIKDDVETEVRRLKETPGGPIDTGGAGLGNSLAELGLIDELMMVVSPIALGGGKAFLGPAFSRTEWKLLEHRTFESGPLLLRYAKA